MKRFLGLALLVVLLVSCSNTGKPSAASTTSEQLPTTAFASVSGVDSTPPAVPTLTPTAAPTETPAGDLLPMPTENIIGNLPDPAAWKPSLSISDEDYPIVDGSTANLPLGVYVRAKITGKTLSECESETKFSKTSAAWAALTDDKVDLLLVYESASDFDNTNKNFVKKIIGKDALVFLTNHGNPVNSLSEEQIVNIYTGKIKNWREVGGNNIAIVPYQRQADSGSQALMVKLVMKGKAMMEVPTTLKPGAMYGLVDAIANYNNTSNAIGYSVFYYVSTMYRVHDFKLLSVDGIAPSSDTIASGAYPFVNPFYAVIRTDEPAGSPAHQLFDWLTGAEGKRAITDAGYVAVK